MFNTCPNELDDVQADTSITGRNIGGLRMDASGNIELRGEVKTTRIVYATKWWPDYVFSPNYSLPSLESVSSYISQNKHLPGVPSQDTIVANGQDLGELQKIQQQKIEELTLYIIQQNEQIKQQQAQLDAIESKLNALIKK